MKQGTVKITIDPFRSIRSFLLSVIWIAGWVLANGFWSTLVAVICPPWGWYLVVEAILIRTGVL